MRFRVVVVLDRSKMTKEKLPWPGWLFVGAGWLALLAGCVVHSRGTPMWVDELYSYNLIQDPSLSHMLAASGDQCDGSPPLYYFFARAWAALFGTHALHLRLFSSVAFCAAFALLWHTVRRTFGFWPSAVSLALVIGTSHVICSENSNVRFYGLLFALIALAVLLAAKLGESERPSRSLLGANLLIQGALVLCHPLGGIYSAAILVAVLAGDLIFLRRVRWWVALSYPVGWLALLLWFPQILRQADINNPHSWVPVPAFSDIKGVIYGGSDFFALYVLFAVLVAWHIVTRRRVDAPTAASEVPRDTVPLLPDTGRQLLVGAALIGVPLVLWVFSCAVPSNSLFLGRYAIGVSIGWVIMVAQLTAFLFRPLRAPSSVWTKAILVVFIAFQLAALVTAPGPDNGALTGASDTAFGHPELPIVCERSHDFLPRVHYSPQADRYYFLLDWEATTVPEDTRRATVEYKILDAIRRHYSGLYHDHIVDAQEFLRTHPAFLVHDIPGDPWVARRLKPDQYTVTRLEPNRTLFYGRDGVWPMFLVERKVREAASH